MQPLKKVSVFFLSLPSPPVYAPNLRTIFCITKLSVVFLIILFALTISGFCYRSITHYFPALVRSPPQDTLIISVLRFLRTKLRTIPAVWCVFLSILLQLLCVENQPRKEIAEGLENYCIFSIYYITPAPAAVLLGQDLPGFPGVEVQPIVLRIGTISEGGRIADLSRALRCPAGPGEGALSVIPVKY